jgi:hypothetical protein
MSAALRLAPWGIVAAEGAILVAAALLCLGVPGAARAWLDHVWLPVAVVALWAGRSVARRPLR